MQRNNIGLSSLAHAIGAAFCAVVVGCGVGAAEHAIVLETVAAGEGRGTVSRLAKGPDGMPHVIYADAQTKTARYATKTETGAWKDEVIGPTAIGGQFHVASMDIAVSPTGKVAVAYVDGEGNLIRYGERSGDAWSWTTIPGTEEIDVPNGLKLQYRGGLPVIGYQSQSAVVLQMFNGKQWDRVSLNHSVSDSFQGFDMAIDTSGKVHMVDVTSYQAETRLWYAAYDGNNWERKDDIAGHGNCERPGVTLDKAGSPCVVFRDAWAPGTLQWAVRNRTGWQIAALDNTNAGFTSSSVVDDRGRTVIAYLRFSLSHETQGPGGVLVVVDQGRCFSYPFYTERHAGLSPCLVVPEDGVAWITYHDTVNAGLKFATVRYEQLVQSGDAASQPIEFVTPAPRVPRPRTGPEASPTRDPLVSLSAFSEYEPPLEMAVCKSVSTKRVLRVPQDYPGVQKAVDAATSDDLVLLAPGDYAGDIRLHDGVTLGAVGVNTVCLRGQVEFANGVRLINLSFADAAVGPARWGSKTERYTHLKHPAAPTCSETSEYTLHDVDIVGCRFRGRATGRDEGLLLIRGVKGLRIVGCVFSSATGGERNELYAVHLQNCQDTVFAANIIADLRHGGRADLAGLVAEYCSGEISHNIVTELAAEEAGSYGLWIKHPRGLTVVSNTVRNLVAGGRYSSREATTVGIGLTGEGAVTIERNMIDNLAGGAQNALCGISSDVNRTGVVGNNVSRLLATTDRTIANPKPYTGVEESGNGTAVPQYREWSFHIVGPEELLRSGQEAIGVFAGSKVTVSVPEAVELCDPPKE